MSKAAAVGNESYPSFFMSTSSGCCLQLKTHKFAIAIIVGIIGMAVGATGLSGYFHVGALSTMSQVDAIIMMAAGGVGIILLGAGVVGALKNRESDDRPLSLEEKRAEIITTINTQGGLVYGPQAWRVWDIEVIDKVPAPPKVDLSQGDKILLYIPQQVKFRGEERTFDLAIVKTIGEGQGLFKSFEQAVERVCQENGTIGCGEWVIADKPVIAESLGKDHQTMVQTVRERGGRLPSVIELIMLHLTVFTFTGVRFNEGNDIECHEMERGYPVIVGSCVNKEGSLKLFVSTRFNTTNQSGNSINGAICVRCPTRSYKG